MAVIIACSSIGMRLSALCYVLVQILSSRPQLRIVEPWTQRYVRYIIQLCEAESLCK
jgi:hypothetical protein